MVSRYAVLGLETGGVLVTIECPNRLHVQILLRTIYFARSGSS